MENLQGAQYVFESAVQMMLVCKRCLELFVCSESQILLLFAETPARTLGCVCTGNIFLILETSSRLWVISNILT